MQNIHKILLMTSSLLLVMGAGCTQSTTTTTNATVNANSATVVDNTNTEQTNETTNTNEALENDTTNVNAEVSDTNTNAADDLAVDTSDWLTYTNEEYEFSFMYPQEWGVKENSKNCWILTSPKIQVAKEEFFAELTKTGGGTDAGPHSEVSFCVKDEQVKLDLMQWAEDNTYKYVDEEYRGGATFNSLPAYLIVDLDFGKSSNYFLKVDGTVFSVYYEIVNDSRSEQIDLIAKSIRFN